LLLSVGLGSLFCRAQLEIKEINISNVRFSLIK